MAKKLTGELDRDTILLPYMLADIIIYEAAVFTPYLRAADETVWREFETALGDKAMRIYRHLPNSHWGRGCRGKNGREYILSFMRHWISSMVQRRFGASFPRYFANGRSVDSPAVKSELDSTPWRWERSEAEVKARLAAPAPEGWAR